MYAVVEVGGKQYKVEKGDVIRVEKLIAEEGAEIALDKVLLTVKDDDISVGTPYLKGAQVTAVLLKHVKGEKVISYKYRRRKSSHWKKGHRQKLCELEIKSIKAG
ncbi:MAG: 50S ribosomal protein L21 [Candidatus Omnitrophota bacterium]